MYRPWKRAVFMLKMSLKIIIWTKIVENYYFTWVHYRYPVLVAIDHPGFVFHFDDSFFVLKIWNKLFSDVCTENLFFRKKVQIRELGILAEVESKTFSRLVPRLAQVGDFIFTSFYFSRFPFLFFFRTCFLFTPIFWLDGSELEHSNFSLNVKKKSFELIFPLFLSLY